MTSLRIAILLNEVADLTTIQSYMPSNYEAVQTADGQIVIVGVDKAGWTLDDYVIPRLSSGMWVARECALSLLDAVP